jgi:hypothetical protein
MTEINFDFRLIDVSFELFALDDHLNLIENQMERLQKSECETLDIFIRKGKLSSEDPEWHEAIQNFDHRFDFLLPRAFRGPFLVSLYAVYESSVTEIARMIQAAKGQSISLGDFRGDFLDRSKKYFNHILKFNLCTDNNVWQGLKMLAELRNALAHANGRLEMLNSGNRKKIRNWEKQNIGIENYNGYLVVNAGITREIFDLVRSSLEELVERYKDWDSGQKY